MNATYSTKRINAKVGRLDMWHNAVIRAVSAREALGDPMSVLWPLWPAGMEQKGFMSRVAWLKTGDTFRRVEANREVKGRYEILVPVLGPPSFDRQVLSLAPDDELWIIEREGVQPDAPALDFVLED